MKMTSALVSALCLVALGSSFAQAAEARKFSSDEEMCEYLEAKKEAAEDAMRNGYKASDYDKLEAKRKYWKKQYIDRCF